LLQQQKQENNKGQEYIKKHGVKAEKIIVHLKEIFQN